MTERETAFVLNGMRTFLRAEMPEHTKQKIDRMLHKFAATRGVSLDVLMQTFTEQQQLAEALFEYVLHYEKEDA